MSGVRVPAPPPPSWPIRARRPRAARPDGTAPPARRVRLRRVEPVLRRALRAGCRVPPGATLLVAVSGGADSVALLLGLHHLAHEFGYRLRAAHLHHGLRGAAADGDLAFVRALCRRLGIPLVTARMDARAEMARRGLAGQAGLRRLRRTFLVRAARACGARAIATAHNANDQIETLLMRIGRGTGLTGLGGIPERRAGFVRPLLLSPRSDIESDLRAAGQPWREDVSNRDPEYLRSRIRHLALAALVRAMDPDGRAGDRTVALHAARACSEARDGARLLRARAVRVLSRATSIQEGEIALDSRGFAAYAPFFRRTVLRQLWTRLAPQDPGLTHFHLTALERLTTSPRRGAEVRLPGGWTARPNRESIVFRRESGPTGDRPEAGRVRTSGSRVRSGANDTMTDLTLSSRRRRPAAAPGPRPRADRRARKLPGPQGAP